MRNYFHKWNSFRRILLLAVAGLFYLPGLAQKTITGEVTGLNNEPFPGVSVVLKGTPTGTTTNSSGKYSIQIPSNSSILVFSSVGFAEVERVVGNNSIINIQLQPSVTLLDETVIIGYGTSKRSNLTGSVSTVKGEDIRLNPVGNVTKGLQGLAPGVDVTSPNTPGSNAKLRIHGLGTINNNDPLWVIDGVPSAGGLSSLNPDEVESVTVLKDAASTAIYGSRGANGVILVTTIQGKKNQAPQLSFSIRAGQIRNNKKYDMLNPTEFGEMLWLQSKNSGVAPTSPIYGSGPEPAIPHYLVPAGANDVDIALYDINNYQITESNPKGTDWYSEIYNPGVTQEYNLSVRGGSKNTTYAISSGFMDESGMVKLTGFNRYNLRANIKTNVTKWLEIGQNIGLSNTNTMGYSGEGLGSALGQALELANIMPVYDVMGNYAPVSRMTGLSGDDNPVATLNRQKDFTNKSLGLHGNAYIAVYPIKNLSIKSLVGIDYSDGHVKQPLERNPESYVAMKYDQLTEGYSQGRQWSWTNTIDYSKTFLSIHSFDILLGTEAVDSRSESISAQRTNFFTTSADYWVLNAGEGEQTNGGSASEWALLSYFGRLHYDLSNKYLLDITVRRDGSSRFGAANRYGTFPSVAAGWRISDEKFMAPAAKWVNFLKLRAGWGQAGNDQIGNYNGFNTFTSNLQFSFYPITGSNNLPTSGFQSAAFGNPNAKWETITTKSIGIDATLFHHLDLTVDFWKRNTNGMLYPKTIPSVYGIASVPSVNIGDMKNVGIDLQINYHGTGLNKDLSYNITANFSHYKNELIKITDKDQEAIIGSAIREQTYIRSEKGTSFPEFYGYDILGIFQNDEEVANYPAFGTYNKPGHFKIKDVDGNGVIDANDRTYIGDPHPDFTAGLIGNVQYKRFDLSATLYASYGNDLLNLNRRTLDFNLFLRNRSTRRLYESWGSPYLKDNKDAKMPIAEVNDQISQQPSSYYVEDGSYLRLTSVQFGYNLPEHILNNISLKNLRIYIMATNLFTITGYSGLDPSVSTDDRGLGLDFADWPTPQRFIVGINLDL